MENIIIGIIGGSGLDDPNILKDRKELEVETPFGPPSDKLVCGTVSGFKCILLGRHGKKHHLNPTNVNYRANIWALKNLGVKCILVSFAVGSLKEEIKPGHVVLLDQFIDRTTKRISTFYDGSSPSFPGVLHISMANPFSPEINQVLNGVLKEMNVSYHGERSIVVIEGPRFSTKAESFAWKSYGASVVGMTAVPEVCLAAELGIPYAGVALVTDMDSWNQGDHVNVEKVMQQMKKNSDYFVEIILKSIPLIHDLNWKNIQQDYEARVTLAKM